MNFRNTLIATITTAAMLGICGCEEHHEGCGHQHHHEEKHDHAHEHEHKHGESCSHGHTPQNPHHSSPISHLSSPNPHLTIPLAVREQIFDLRLDELNWRRDVALAAAELQRFKIDR